MNSNIFHAVILIIFVGLSEAIASTSCVGCVDLDEITFDKLISKFKYSIVKFDTAFPYGAKHEAYGAFAREVFKSNEDLLVAHVGIKNYGENENEALGKRFKVNEKHFPVIIFFKNGDTDNFIKFSSKTSITVDNLKTFVMGNSNLYIGLEGCSKKFNELVDEFHTKTKEDMTKLIEKATAIMKNLSNESEKTTAKYYLTFMKKIVEKGPSFVEDETSRLKKLQAGKLSKLKKTEIQKKLNILQAFQIKSDMNEKPKNEL